MLRKLRLAAGLLGQTPLRAAQARLAAGLLLIAAGWPQNRGLALSQIE
jgi:hypothetical protein